MEIRKEFLEIAKKEQHLVSVFLSTGVKLQGHIVNYDNETLQFLCPKDNNRIVIFLQYVTTISSKQDHEGHHNCRSDSQQRRS